MFSADHFIWLGISLVIFLLLFFLSCKYKWSFKTATYVLLGIYVSTEIFKILTHMFPATRWLGEGATVSGFDGDLAKYLLPKSLPFQLCSFMIFFVIYMAFSKNEKGVEIAKSFSIQVFIIAGSLALLLATCLDKSNTAHVFDSFRPSVDKQMGAYYFFYYHVGMVWYGVYLIKTKQVQMGFKIWLRNLGLLLGVFAIGMWVNSILLVYEVNFMFLVAPPAKGLPLLNLNHGWHIYLLNYALVAVVLTFLFQLPAIIIELRKKKASA